MKKIKIFLILLLLPQWIILNILKNNPLWVEFYYSNGLYPRLFRLKHFFFQYLPFSLGDLIYIFLIILALFGGIHWLRKKEKKISPILLNLGGGISLILLFFNLSWGLNYYRLPLNERLEYDLTYNEKALTKTLEQLITSANDLQERLTDHDSLPVVFPFSNQGLNMRIKKEYKIAGKNYGIQPLAKPSLISTLLSYMGYAGYLNPFTLEAQVNAKMPKISMITTTAHEMAHQMGYAAENEANFIAFMHSVENNDPYIQYAGYTFGLRYCYYELAKVNPEKAQALSKKIHPGILKNFKEIRTFWEAYTNPFEPLLKKGYDNYLKANGQKSGIESYNEMVAYIIHYLR